ncbi:MAG: thiamine diphosphokinase [Proteobacteria bacterium]|nr:thiamine diphosphokinase [Pseudomonadota bacterium]
MEPRINALVLLNGEKPSKTLLEEFWYRVDYRVCADGAAEVLYQYQLEPDIILGDLDSLRSEIGNGFPAVEILKIPDQNTTDGEKAFQYCLDNRFQKIQVFGALGKRADHGLYNLGLLKKFHLKGIETTIHTEDEEIFLLDKKHRFFGRPGTRISLIPIFGTVTGVVTQGLVYPMNQTTLELGSFSSISNEFAEESASVDLASGELLALIERKKESGGNR